MKAPIAFTIAALLAAAPTVLAQAPSVPQQTAPIRYGAVPRPQQKPANVRKPQQLANAPVRQAQQQQPAAHYPTTRSSPQTTRPTARTAQVSYGQPTLAAPVPPPSISAPTSDGYVGGSVEGETTGGCSGDGGSGSISGNYPYGPMNRIPLRWGWYVTFWHSTGDMPQHLPYFPNAHGYYYFHPYNVIHVNQQQEMVAKWGLDPRNPLDNRFFERIYQEQEAAQINDTLQPVMPR